MRNFSEQVFFWKSVSFRFILLKIVHKHAGIYSSIIKLLLPGIILWLCRPNIFFFTPTLYNMLLPKIPRSWRCCMVIPKENIVSICLRGACVRKQKKKWFNESLVVIWLYWNANINWVLTFYFIETFMWRTSHNSNVLGSKCISWKPKDL